MQKKCLLVFLLSFMLSSSLFAYWKPVIETGVGVNLTHAMSFEDSVFFRTSGSSEVNVILPNWSVGAFELGLPISILTNTASVPYSGVRNLSFTELSLAFSFKWNIVSFYSLVFSLGGGYGIFRDSESGYALLSASLAQQFEIDRFVSLTQKFALTYRAGMLDFRTMVGLALTLRGERR